MLLLLLDIWNYLRMGSGNQAFVKLGEQLVPVLKVQSTSCINSPCPEDCSPQPLVLPNILLSAGVDLFTEGQHFWPNVPTQYTVV